MKAAYLTGIRSIEIREIDPPALGGDDEVLLRVGVVGVCGSDLHYYRTGHIGDQGVRFPWRLGHEFGATVEQAGSAVKNVAAGDRVAVDPLIACGTCDQCRSGRAHTCRNQVFMGCPGQLEGCLAEYLVMPAKCCYRLGEKLTLIDAALSEPFSICLHAQRLARLADGMNVAVLGAGPMGLGVTAAIKANASCRLCQTDLLDERLAVARKMGADWTGNAADAGEVMDALAAQAPGGMDRVFECAGQQATLEAAAELLAPGGLLVIVGIPETDWIRLPMDSLRRKELSIQNVRRQNDCVADALEAMAAGQVDLSPLVTHHFDLGQTQEAFERVAEYRDGVVKAMIHLDE
jgi:L-iditol 2-dehydrogenase